MVIFRECIPKDRIWYTGRKVHEAFGHHLIRDIFPDATMAFQPKEPLVISFFLVGLHPQMRFRNQRHSQKSWDIFAKYQCETWKFFFLTKISLKQLLLGITQTNDPPNPQAKTTRSSLHKVDAISRSSVLRTSLFFLKRPVQMLFCLKLVHKTGVIKWDPFWGESNNTHLIMAILRDFPFNNALFWLGNIIMTSNKVSSVHGWEDKLSKSIFCIIS